MSEKEQIDGLCELLGQPTMAETMNSMEADAQRYWGSTPVPKCMVNLNDMTPEEHETWINRVYDILFPPMSEYMAKLLEEGPAE